MAEFVSQPLLPPGWQLPEKEAFLADMREAVAGHPYPGYPMHSERLYIPRQELQYDSQGRPIFPANPSAPYTVFDHSVNPLEPRPAHAYHDGGDPLPSTEAAEIHWGDMERDARGFPMHTYAVEMVTDPAIGGIVGPGYYYHPGLTLTTDLGVTARAVPGETVRGNRLALRASPEQTAAGGLHLAVLLVRRTDTDQLALPGGEIDPGETAVEAAVREAREETGMGFSADDMTRQGACSRADPRLTTCTEVINELFTVDAGDIPCQMPAGDGVEVSAAQWLITDTNLLAPRVFFGAHRRMLFETVDWYQRRHDVTVMDDGRIVPNNQ